MEPFLNTVQNHSGLFTSIVSPSGEGISVSYKVRVRPVHIIGVPLDLGGARRGVDMGPSAFRIAGLGDRISELGCTVVDHGDLPVADSRNAEGRRSDEEVHQRDRAGLPQPVRRGAAVARFGRAAAGARRRSQPRRGLGGRERRLRSAHDVVPARPDLGGRARRHEHAADDDHRQRARDAAGGAARTGAGGAGVDRIVAVGARRSTPCSSAFAISTRRRRTRSARPACTSSR